MCSVYGKDTASEWMSQVDISLWKTMYILADRNNIWQIVASLANNPNYTSCEVAEILSISHTSVVFQTWFNQSIQQWVHLGLLSERNLLNRISVCVSVFGILKVTKKMRSSQTIDVRR